MARSSLPHRTATGVLREPAGLLNACALVETDLAPRQATRGSARDRRRTGRVRDIPNGPPRPRLAYGTMRSLGGLTCRPAAHEPVRVKTLPRWAERRDSRKLAANFSPRECAGPIMDPPAPV